MSSDAIGRVYAVHPNNRECFYLRLLLHTVRGATSFRCLRTYDGQVMDLYCEACARHCILEDDQHWQTTRTEAAAMQAPRQLRQLFAILVQVCGVSEPLQLWNAHKQALAARGHTPSLLQRRDTGRQRRVGAV